MYKEVSKNELIDVLKKENINYEVKIRNKKDKMIKVHKTQIDEIDIDDVKSVEFFIKKFSCGNCICTVLKKFTNENIRRTVKMVGEYINHTTQIDLESVFF